MSDDNNKLEFNTMPGADRIDEADEKLDFNFGLGEEPAAELEEDEPEAELEEEEPVAEDEQPKPELSQEPEVEAELEEESEPEPEPDTKKPMVPKSRLDEVLTKQKALQKQLDDLMATRQADAEAPSDYDFSEKEIEYQNLVLDGESQKAAALRAEIRAAERAQLEYEMTQKMSQQVTQSQQMTALQQAASDLEANFPVFDANSGDYNAEYTQEVIDLRDAFIVKGDNAVAALSKAAKFVIREYELDAASPSLSSDTAPKQKQVDELAKKRAEVSRKIKAAESQPPELPGESSANRGEKAFDVNNMTEDEFNALPEATLKRLRGDIL